MFEHAVKNKINLTRDDKKSDFYIAFGISKAFTYPVGVLITSILKNNKDIKISFHIFIDNKIDDKELSRFKELIKFYNTDIIIYEIDNSEFLNLDDKEFTVAAYYRFAIPYQLKDLTNEYLYIDADMVAIRDLKDYLNIDLKDNIAAVVDDFILDKKGNPILLADNKKYFNSGMMYIDLKKWVEYKVSEKCIEILREINKFPEKKLKYGYEFRCFDQDALNIVLKDKVKGVSLKNLRHKGKRRKKETRGKFLIGNSITTRPKDVKSRKTFGHWELDTIVSSRGKSKACLATFVERKTRFYVAIKIKDRTAPSMLKVIKKLVKVLPKKALKTFTTDRGKEFACYKEVEKLNIKVYFADAYAAWQNGLLREYYPKKTDLGKISNDDLIEKLILLNSRPRKCLNWDNPFNLFLKEVSHLD